MSILVLGVVIFILTEAMFFAGFIGAHLVPSVPSLRERLSKRFGNNPYRGLFSLVSLTGFVLLVIGKGRAPFVPLWNPPAWAPQVAVWVMPFALTLLVAAFLPNNLKRFTRHPMLWGVSVWAAVHLLANGDLASLILFGSFGAFALFDMWSANRRGAGLSSKVVPYWRDLLVITVGAIVYMGFLHGHAMLFGVPVAFGS